MDWRETDWTAPPAVGPTVHHISPCKHREKLTAAGSQSIIGRSHEPGPARDCVPHHAGEVMIQHIERQFVRTSRPLYGHLVSLVESAIARGDLPSGSRL